MMKKITIVTLLLIASASYSFSYSQYYTASNQQSIEQTLIINERLSINFYLLAYRGNPNYTTHPGASVNIWIWAKSDRYDYDQIIDSRGVSAYDGISATTYQGVAYDPNGRIYKIDFELTSVAPADYCFARIWW